METKINQHLSRETLNAITTHAIDKIATGYTDSLQGCDLHNRLFNEDYFIIGRYEAEQWLISHGGIFSAIDVIKEYEEEQLGEVTTDLSEPEKVVNMYVYILGEIVLGDCPTVSANWDKPLTAADYKTIISELEALN